VVLYSTLGLCALLAAVLVYQHDLYDREPWLLLGLTVALGAGAIGLAGRAEAWTFAALRLASPGSIAAVAALLEEMGKLAVVTAIALLARRAFNDPMDGIIYGSMAGLGMAIEESVYCLRASTATVLPPEELVRICGHLIMGGIGGFPLGMARIRRRGWPLAVASGFAAAVGLHFGWDWLALTSSTQGFTPGQTGLAVALMLGGMLVYGTLLTIASHWSHAIFAPALPERLWAWGWPFDRIGRRREG